MDYLFPFHPRLVHYPIALCLTGVLFLAIGLIRSQERWIWYGRLSLILGWASAIVAALAGLVDQSRAPDLPAIASAINQHITVGIALIIVFGFALYLPLRDKRYLADTSQRWIYIALLLLGAGLVLLEGWLGGKLVYEMGVGVR